MNSKTEVFLDRVLNVHGRNYWETILINSDSVTEERSSCPVTKNYPFTVRVFYNIIISWLQVTEPVGSELS